MSSYGSRRTTKSVQNPFIPAAAFAQSPNSKLIDSPLCVRRMLSAIVGLMSSVTSFAQRSWCSCCGIVFVTCDVWIRVRERIGEVEVKRERERTMRVSMGRESIVCIRVSEKRPA